MLHTRGPGSFESVLGVNGKTQAIGFSWSQQSEHHKLLCEKGTKKVQPSAEKGKVEY